jgi:hypothetical protein
MQSSPPKILFSRPCAGKCGERVRGAYGSTVTCSKCGTANVIAVAPKAEAK